MREYILMHTPMTNTFDIKIILHIYNNIIFYIRDSCGLPEDAPGIHRFSSRKWVLTM